MKQSFADVTHEITTVANAGPTVWNSLPDHLRDPAVDSEQFRRDFNKTYLFAALKVSRNRALQIDIYLLTQTNDSGLFTVHSQLRTTHPLSARHT